MIKSGFSRRLLLMILAVCATLCFSTFAQNGDRKDKSEEQTPLVPAEKIPPAPLLSPEEALKSFKLPPGFHIELVAGEPLVHTPIQIAFDPSGRLWVLEMRGYMPNADGVGEQEPVASVAILEDTDGDGRMDKRTEFVTGLIMPRALALVRDGALVAEPPKLLFMPELAVPASTSAKAGERIEIATDYATQSDPKLGAKANHEHSPNGLMWALDNWIYSANHTVRFRNISGKWETSKTRARGQWGISQDDYGRLVYNSNSDQLRVDLVPAEYLDRNPNFVSPSGANYQPQRNQSVWPSRVNPGVNRGYRRDQLRPDGTLATFTAACGPVVYRGDQFPDEFRGNVFLCEPSANVVRRDVLEEKDCFISANNPYDKTEFLTSTDEWFRPVNLNTGPDGALYVVDMHHGIIQHRIYLTSYLRKQSEDRGLDKAGGYGRIFRVVSDAKKPGPAPQLARTDSSKLIDALSHPNGWWRDTAQRLLVERHDQKTVPALSDLALKGSNPLGRLHALYVLQGLDGLTTNLLLQALGDAHPKVRVAALRLAEPFMRKDSSAKALFLARATQLLAEGNPDVALQLAFSFGEAPGADSDAFLADLARIWANHTLISDAVVTSLKGRELELLSSLCNNQNWATNQPGYSRFLANLSKCVYKEAQTNRVNQLLELVASQPPSETWRQTAVLNGIASFIPAATRGQPAPRIRPLKLDAEPTAFAKIAAIEAPEVKKVFATVNKLITWPNKPGEPVEVAVKPLTAEQQTMFDQGKALYATICGACHQPHGRGQEGLAPPLLDSEWALGSEQRMVRIALQGVRGPIRVKGQSYALDMPGLWVLDDTQLASILTYVRREWGHTADPISADAVKTIRAETDKRNEPWSEAELLKIH